MSMEGITSPNLPADDDALFAYSLIEANGGISYLDLLKLMGESARSAIDCLIRGGIVSLEDNGMLKLVNGGPVVKAGTALNLARVLISRFTREGDEHSKITLMIDGVTHEGIEMLNALSKEYIKTASRIIDNNKGKIPVFLFRVFDVMEFKKSSDVTRGDHE
jgi:hypothetical protein